MKNGPELTEVEKKILNWLNNILLETNKLKIDDDLIKNCSSDLKINEKKIIRILYSLINKKILVPYKEISKNSLLENDMKKAIYETIEDNPGITINQLNSKLNLSIPTILSIILVLNQYELVKIEPNENIEAAQIFPLNTLKNQYKNK